MQQTAAHEAHNPDLLALVPKHLTRVVEVGSSSGALAREYKTICPTCHYVGIEVDPRFAELSKRYCDQVVCADIETLAQPTFDSLFPSDCWIFGDTLEHLKDPWTLLKRIRGRLTPDGCLVACIPNAQHWSVQARLNCGMLHYEDSGLLDRTHLRWFTRLTIIELFESTGFRIVSATSRIFNEPNRDNVRDAIRLMAKCIGADPEQAIMDSTAFQYVVRATPA
jgi:SAM-dependent methyltransferase